MCSFPITSTDWIKVKFDIGSQLTVYGTYILCTTPCQNVLIELIHNMCYIYCDHSQEYIFYDSMIQIFVLIQTAQINQSISCNLTNSQSSGFQSVL